MSSCTQYDPPKLYAVVLESREERHLYLFVKRVPIPDKSLWEKIAHKNGRTFTKSDREWISLHLPLSIQRYLESDIPIHIVDETIYGEDTIQNVRKKICMVLSQPSRRQFILPAFQELWTYESLSKKNNPIPLGVFYKPIPFEPSITQVPTIDYERFIDMDGTYKIGIQEESNLFMIVEKIVSDSYPIFHVTNLLDEIHYLKKKGIELTELFWKGYIQRHWLKVLESVLSNFQLQEKEYNLIREQMDQYDLVNEFMDEYSIPDSSIQYCSINQVTIKIGYDTMEDTEKNIDLLKLFYHLKKYISPTIPFMKYMDPTWDSPYCVIDKTILEERVMTDERLRGRLKEWVFKSRDESKIKGELKQKIHKSKGLQIKIFDSSFGKDTEIQNYMTVFFFSTGKIEIRHSYEAVQQAYFKNIYHVLEIIKEFVEKVNTNDFRLRKTEERDLYPLPQFSWDHGELKLGENTFFPFFNFYVGLNLDFDIRWQDLRKMIPLFTNYISDITDDAKIAALMMKGPQARFEVIYNRVSNFKNMNEIYRFITRKKESGYEDYDIQIMIQKTYDKTSAEASHILYEYSKFIRKLLEKSGKIIETGTKITLRKDVLQLMNCKDEHQLRNILWFIRHFLGCYLHLSTIEKKLIKRGYSSLAKWESKEEDISLIEKVYTSSLTSSANENSNNENSGSYFYSNNNSSDTLGINLEAYLNQNDMKEGPTNEELEAIPNEQNTMYQGNMSVPLAKNSEIGKDIQLKCPDAIRELDTCADICNDEKYTLRRLQRYDNVLFKFTAKKFKQYARICSKTQEQQPIVIPYDPSTNPKIDKRSYSYSIRAGSNPNRQYYYICPRVWCPFCLIPIYIEKVKNIQTKILKSGKCQVGLCPNGNHQVMIFASDYFDGLKKEHYPGFLNPSEHPDGYCLPCCYKKAQNVPTHKKYAIFKRCLGEEVQMTQMDTYYILGKEKIPLEEYRYGMLPPLVAKFFQSTCETGYLEHGMDCYLRYGINQTIRPSFLYSLYIALQSSTQSLIHERNITFEKFRTYLKNSCSRSMFLSLHQGALQHIFRDPLGKFTDPYEYYLYYLETSPNVNEKYVWDFLSRPGILYPKGMNLFLFSKAESESFVCPIGFEPDLFYHPDRPSIFLVHMKSFYEPVSYIKRDIQGKVFTRMIFDRHDIHVQRAIHIMKEECKQKYTIDWLLFLKDSLVPLDPTPQTIKMLELLAPPNEIPSEDVLHFLEEKKVEKETIEQVMDTYGKCIGFYTNKVYYPTLPSGLKEDLPNVVDYFDISWQDPQITFTNYQRLFSYGFRDYKPVAWIQSYTKPILVGLVLQCGRIIPMTPTPRSKKWEQMLKVFQIPFYKNANRWIQLQEEKLDPRKENISYLEFEQESYQRFRLECGTYLQLHPTMKKEVLQILYDMDKTVSEKRMILLPLLDSMMSKCITFTRPKHDPYSYDTYTIPNYRTSCITSKEVDCRGNPHCVWNKDEKKAKLYLNKELFTHKKPTYTFFLYELLEELLRNRLMREEILQLSIPDILNKRKIEVGKDQVLLTNNHPLQTLQQYYQKIEEYSVQNDVYNLAEPVLVDEQDRSKYMVTRTVEWFDLPSEVLPSQWDPYLKDYTYFDFENQSLWQSLTLLGNTYVDKIPVLQKILDEMDHASQFSPMLWKMWFLKSYMKMQPEEVGNAFLPLPIANSHLIQLTGDGIDRIMQLSRLVAPNIWGDSTREHKEGVRSWDQYQSVFLQSTFEGTELEISYLGKLLGMQFVILYKRPPKFLVQPITCLGNVDKQPKYTIFLYSKFYEEVRTFHLVHLEDIFIVPNETIPGKMYQMIQEWYRTQSAQGMSVSGMSHLDRVDENVERLADESMMMMPMNDMILPKKRKLIKRLKH